MTSVRDPQSLLTQYRAALSPAHGASEQALLNVSMRLARGDQPIVPVSDPPELPRESVGFSGLQRMTVAKTVAATMGGIGAVMTAGWLWVKPAEPASPTRSVPTDAARAGEQAASQAEPANVETEAGAASPVATPNKRVHLPATPTTPTTPRHPSRARSRAKEPDEKTSEETAVVAEPAATPAVAQPTEQAPDASLGRELQLIRAAYRALREGQNNRALALLAEHAQLFPSGSLTESRHVARITALKKLGQVGQAKAEAQEFLRAYPTSPSAGRVRSLMVDLPESDKR